MHHHSLITNRNERRPAPGLPSGLEGGLRILLFLNLAANDAVRYADLHARHARQSPIRRAFVLP
jgi:hypothetical protein